METQISFSNQEKYPRQGFMQRNALSVKIILIGVLILILLIPLAMIRGLISVRSETASEATTEVQNKWSSSQLVTGLSSVFPAMKTTKRLIMKTEPRKSG